MRSHESLPAAAQPTCAPLSEDRETLLKRIVDTVRACTYRQISNLHITLSTCGTEVHLHGHAPSFYIKQMAQEGVMRHGLRVHNNIQVATAV